MLAAIGKRLWGWTPWCTGGLWGAWLTDHYGWPGGILGSIVGIAIGCVLTELLLWGWARWRARRRPRIV